MQSESHIRDIQVSHALLKLLISNVKVLSLGCWVLCAIDGDDLELHLCFVTYAVVDNNRFDQFTV